MAIGRKWLEITTIEKFREILKSGNGYIVITDSANPCKVHMVPCTFIKEENFATKVIVNHNRQGRYYWISHMDQAADWGATPCSRCIG